MAISKKVSRQTLTALWIGLLITWFSPVTGLSNQRETPMHYYGIDRAYKTVEYGEVTLERALEIIDDRFSKFKPKYPTMEEAIAETMFGFYRTKDTFIEICINAPDKISFKFEYPLSKKVLIFQNVYRREADLTTKEELIERVEHFFGSSNEEYKKYLELKKG